MNKNTLTSYKYPIRLHKALNDFRLICKVFTLKGILVMYLTRLDIFPLTCNDAKNRMKSS